MFAIRSLRRSETATSAVTFTALLALALGCLAGCQSTPKRFVLHGHVLAKDDQFRQLTLNHEAIPGFMPAMAMSYTVKDSQGLNAVEPGDQITADIVAASGENYWLEHLTVTDSSGRAAAAAAALPPPLRSGAPIPDVALTNQDGKTLHLRQFKGKAVLVTFIYTRCPFADFCPRISSQFAAIHNELARTSPDLASTHLVTISLDPAYDTPHVLRKYGLGYLQGKPEEFSHWDFVATSAPDLKKLAAAFGLAYYDQGNQIAHSMETVLIAPDGSVARSWPGSGWQTSEVLAAMRREAPPQPK